jgi:GT2 family glycosyltransferase
MSPRIAVALVHYHSEALLRRCLRRLCRSAEAAFDAVVVDNGSVSALDWVPALDRRLRLVSGGRNLGFSAGVNLALRSLSPSAPFVLLLNPDVLIEPDTLPVVAAALEEDGALGAATCRLVLPSGEMDPACRRADPDLISALGKQTGLRRLWPRWRRLTRYHLDHLDPDTPHRVGAASGAFLMLRRDALDRVGGLDERYFLYGEDLDLCRTLRGSGWEIGYVPAARATHVKGSGRIRSLATTRHFYEAMWIYYRKWGTHRDNPLVLGPLALGVTGLGLLEAARNEWRRRREKGGALSLSALAADEASDP